MSESDLRWALYDGVYYAALYVQPSEAPMPVGPNETFVFFLDGESGAVMPSSDVLPYDPNDTAKTSRPEAAEGVRLAAKILYGDGASGQPHEAVATLGTEELDALLAAEDEENEDVDREDSAAAARTKRKEQKRQEKEERRRLKQEKRARRHREEEEEDEDEEEEEETSPARRNKTKSGRAAVDDGEDELELEEGRDDRGGYAFGGVTEDFGLGDDAYANRRTVAVRRGMSGALSALADRGSPVMRYVPTIHSTYERMAAEAEAQGGLLSVPVQEVVRAMEHKLRQRAGLALHLEQLLRKATQDVGGAAADEEEDKDEARYLRELQQRTPEQQEADIRALEAQIDALERDLDVPAEVAQLVQVIPRPPTFEEQRARRVRATSRFSSFGDPSVRLLLDRAQAPPANIYSPELASKYLEQRQRRERLLSFQRGLGKLGLHAPRQRPMEQWMSARELMVLAVSTEVQPVAPNGYIARKHATATQRMEDHTRRRLSTLQTQQQRTQEQAEEFGLHPLEQGAHDANRLLSTFESSTRKQRQMLPVYYDFSNLSGAVSTGTADQVRLQQQPLRADGATTTQPRNTLEGLLQTQEEMDELEGHDGLGASGGPTVLLPLDADTVRVAQEHVLPQDEAQLAQEVARQQADGAMHSVYYDAGQRFLPTEAQVSMWYSNSVPMESTRPHSAGHRSSTGERRRSRDDPVRTWRDAAKRSILEECTCLLKGAHGRPKLLPAAKFEAVAKTLLERALLEQGSRAGVSLSLKSTNATIQFTKDTERQLRKSVQTYVQRHYGEGGGGGDDSGSRGDSDVDEERRGRRGGGRLQQEQAAVVTDSPQYV